MIFHDLETSGNRSVGFVCRGVAQLGRALRSGRRGRGFESRRLDHIEQRRTTWMALLCLFFIPEKLCLVW